MTAILLDVSNVIGLYDGMQIDKEALDRLVEDKRVYELRLYQGEPRGMPFDKITEVREEAIRENVEGWFSLFHGYGWIIHAVPESKNLRGKN